MTLTLEQRHLDRKRSPAEWIGGSMCDDLKRCAVMQRTCISFTCRVPCLPLPSMVLENCSEKLGCDVGLPVPEEFCAGWRLNRPIMPLTPPVLCQAVMSTLSRRTEMSWYPTSTAKTAERPLPCFRDMKRHTSSLNTHIQNAHDSG